MSKLKLRKKLLYPYFLPLMYASDKDKQTTLIALLIYLRALSDTYLPKQ